MHLQQAPAAAPVPLLATLLLHSTVVVQVRVDGAAVAAENARLVQQNQAALQQLRALTQVLEEQRDAGHAGHAAPGGAELAELLEENEQLRQALEEASRALAGAP